MNQDVDSSQTCVLQQMETGMKAPGRMARRTEMESSTTLTKANFMRAFGWMESLNVGPCLILGEMKHQHRQSIQFQRCNILIWHTFPKRVTICLCITLNYKINLFFFQIHLKDMQLVLSEAKSAFCDQSA